MADPKPSSSTTARKPKAQTSRPAKATYKTPLSAELVGNSDDCDEETSTESRKKDAKIKNPTATAPEPVAARPTIGGVKQSKKRKGPSPAPNRAISKGSGTMKDSRDISIAEDDSNGSSSSRDPRPTPVGATNSARVRAAHAKPPKPLMSKAIAPSKNSEQPDSRWRKRLALDSASEEESESSSVGSSEAETEDESASSNKTSIQSPRKCSPAHKLVPKPALLPYEPPPGFEPAFISSHPSSKITEILASSNLAGKQLWHITVPSSIPVTAIKELSAQSLQSGNPIFSYKGADYGLVPKSGAEASIHALLLPSTHTNDYQPCRIPLLRTLHLQQLVKIPIRAYQTTGVPDPTSKPQTHVKAVRQQPEGLKMRYHAFGTSDHSDSDVSATTAFKAPEFRIPDASVRPSKKRKLSNNVADSTEVSPTKVKKHKARHEIPVRTEDSAMDIDSPKNEKLEESSRSSVASPVEIRANVFNGVESSTERKREKDGKRHKDRKTPTASQSILPTDLTKEAETIMPEEVVHSGAGINRLPPEMESKAAKAQPKEEKRKRKEIKKVTPAKAEDSPLAKSNAPIQQGLRSYSREPSVHLPTPGHSSPHKTTATTNDSQAMLEISSQGLPHKETKEEKARRKENRKKRNLASDLM